MKPASARHRVDGTAKALEAAAKALGVGVVPLGGTVDCALFLGHVVRLCDWKVPGKAGLTEGQGRLIAAGAPIHFVSTVPQLELLVENMKRETGR
jgi:hypothetical protein